MGLSLAVECNKCKYTSEIIVFSYGGIYNHYTYLCNECNSFFNYKKRVFISLAKCNYCGSRRVKKINTEKAFYDDKSNKCINCSLECPKCNGKLNVFDEIELDD